MSEASEKLIDLEKTLLGLHTSVANLISVIGKNASRLEGGEEALNKLPILDFYNDDLLRITKTLRDSSLLLGEEKPQ